MAENDIDEEQLNKANEPAFTEALEGQEELGRAPLIKCLRHTRARRKLT